MMRGRCDNPCTALFSASRITGRLNLQASLDQCVRPNLRIELDGYACGVPQESDPAARPPWRKFRVEDFRHLGNEGVVETAPCESAENPNEFGP